MSHLILDRFAVINCIGSGACQLLQGQTSADIVALKPRQGCFFTLCNPKGRMLVNGIILHPTDDNYQLIVIDDLASICIDTLSRFAPFYQATLTRLDKRPMLHSDDQSCALTWPETIHFSLVDEQSGSDESQQEWFAKMLSFGIVFLHHNESGQYLPSDIGWNTFGVSFSKGCYSGQEIIARIHYRGTPKQRMYIASTNDDINMTDDVLVDHQENNCGTVIRHIQIGTQQWIAARIRPSSIDEIQIADTKLSWHLPSTPPEYEPHIAHHSDS